MKNEEKIEVEIVQIDPDTGEIHATHKATMDAYDLESPHERRKFSQHLRLWNISEVSRSVLAKLGAPHWYAYCGVRGKIAPHTAYAFELALDSADTVMRRARYEKNIGPRMYGDQIDSDGNRRAYVVTDMRRLVAPNTPLLVGSRLTGRKGEE